MYNRWMPRQYNNGGELYHLDGILAKIKGHMPKLKKREKKSHLKVTFSDGTSKDL